MTTNSLGPAGKRHHVVIIGGGFGGLFAAKKFKGKDIAVTIIDRTNHHLFQPLLYQVATGILSEGEIAPSIRQLMADDENVRVIKGEVRNIDIDGQNVTADLGGKEAVI